MFDQGVYVSRSGGGSSGQGITAVVANYSALPSAASAADEFYFVESPQGTAWLPGSLGGTYYPAGLYYSNGVSWFYAESPYQATQAAVNAGLITDQFVSPFTLANATTVERPLTFGQGLVRSGNNIYTKTVPQLILTSLGSVVTNQNFDIMAVTSSANMVSQRLFIPPPIFITEPQTITGAVWFQDVQGAYTASNYNGIGLFSYSAGTLTLVASTTDDGNIWKAAASTASQKAFSTPYVAAAGIYYLGFLWCSSATVTTPALGVRVNLRAGISSFDFTNSAKLSSFVNAVTALPSPTQAMSGTAASNTTTFWGGLY